MLTGSSTFPALPLYKRLSPDFMLTNTRKLSKSAVVQSEVTYFKTKVARLRSVDEFFKDKRLLRFALKAYNLEDQMQYPARIEQILKGDASDSASIVSRMRNAGYREINAGFDFFKSGLAKLKGESFQQELIGRYYAAENERSLGEMNPNVADVLYFERLIGKVKSGYEILGDPILFNVVKTALNLPPQVSGSKVERLKIMIESKFDMTRVKDSKYIKGIAERFLALKDVETRRAEGGGIIDMFA
jgi:hypothetical protein